MDEQIPTFPPPAEFAAQAVAGADLYEEAAEDRLAYWARRAREILHWEQDFTDVLDLSLIHISEPTRRLRGSRMPSSA